MNNVIVFIPARIGSKGILHKNIKLLNDKPLIAYTIECAQRAGIERIIVNTDGNEIAKIAREYGAEVMFVDPKEAEKRGIHQDKSSMYQVLASEIPRIEPQPEIVVLLQATVPFRKKIHISLAIKLLADNSDYDSVISVENVPDKYNPSQILVTTPTGLRMASGIPISQRIKRRQEFPKSYIPTGSIYCFRTKNLESGSFYGDKIMAIETESTINIDGLKQWQEAEQWILSQK